MVVDVTLLPWNAGCMIVYASAVWMVTGHASQVAFQRAIVQPASDTAANYNT